MVLVKITNYTTLVKIAVLLKKYNSLFNYNNNKYHKYKIIEMLVIILYIIKRETVKWVHKNIIITIIQKISKLVVKKEILEFIIIIIKI